MSWKKVVPNYLIETPLVGSFAWVIELSVFFLYGTDWIYLYDDPDWVIVVSIN